MPIKVKFKQFAKNRRPVEVSGMTVRECLDNLARKSPESKKWLFDKNGIIQVLVTLNGEDIYQKDLKRVVADGDELELVLIVGGG